MDPEFWSDLILMIWYTFLFSIQYLIKNLFWTFVLYITELRFLYFANNSKTDTQIMVDR